jgi:hypothetical protein
MATRNETRERNRSSDKKTNSRNGERSAFSFGDSDNGALPLLGALAAGAAIGIGANWARKFLQQKSESMMAGGEWDNDPGARAQGDARQVRPAAGDRRQRHRQARRAGQDHPLCAEQACPPGRAGRLSGAAPGQ